MVEDLAHQFDWKYILDLATTIVLAGLAYAMAYGLCILVKEGKLRRPHNRRKEDDNVK